MNRWPDWSTYGLENDLLPAAEACVAKGERFALATLVHVERTSPRPLGSEMLVSSAGRVRGYLSGGCVEAAVAQEALACLRDGRPRLPDYGQGSEILDIQLTCGGRIHIPVRAIHEPEWWVSQLREVALTRSNRSILLDLSTGQMQAANDDTALAGYFIKTYIPKARLILVGSDPVRLATVPLANAMGIEAVLWRPTGPSTPPAGLILEADLAQSAPEGLQALSLDGSTALYCLTHDMVLDVSILRHALVSEVFCVGVLGSRGKQVLRRQMLQEAGVTETQLARLRSPAGLSIGASSPQEIALSILAEVVSCRRSRGKETRPVDQRRREHALA